MYVSGGAVAGGTTVVVGVAGLLPTGAVELGGVTGALLTAPNKTGRTKLPSPFKAMSTVEPPPKPGKPDGRESPRNSILSAIN